VAAAEWSLASARDRTPDDTWETNQNASHGVGDEAQAVESVNPALAQFHRKVARTGVRHGSRNREGVILRRPSW
jgi:hypothetical protein